jgi:hypothetical protein
MSVSGVWRSPVEKLRTSKRLARLCADCLVWIAALYLASLLRLDFNAGRVNSFSLADALRPRRPAPGRRGLLDRSLPRVVGERLLRGGRRRSPHGRGHHLVLCIIDLLVPGERPAPLSAVIGAGIIAFVGMGGARYDRPPSSSSNGAAPSRSIARRRSSSAAGDGGERTIRAMLFDSDSPYVPVALLDDDPRKRNLTIRGVRVLGDRTHIASLAERFGAKALIMAVPPATVPRA